MSLTYGENKEEDIPVQVVIMKKELQFLVFSASFKSFDVNTGSLGKERTT